jgi:hypothetical protein
MKTLYKEITNQRRLAASPPMEIHELAMKRRRNAKRQATARSTDERTLHPILYRRKENVGRKEKGTLLSQILSLISDLTNWSRCCNRRWCWVARVVLLVISRLRPRESCSSLIDWLSGVWISVVVYRLGFTADWSTNHVIALRIRDPHVFERLDVLRLPWWRLISVR